MENGRIKLRSRFETGNPAIVMKFHDEKLENDSVDLENEVFHEIKRLNLQERKNGHQTRKPNELSNGNNSPERAKSPTPPPDLDVSSRRIIPFGPFDKSFSGDPNDYFY